MYEHAPIAKIKQEYSKYYIRNHLFYLFDETTKDHYTNQPTS